MKQRLEYVSKPAINIFPHANVCYETHVSFLHSLLHSLLQEQTSAVASLRQKPFSVSRVLPEIWREGPGRMTLMTDNCAVKVYNRLNYISLD